MKIQCKECKKTIEATQTTLKYQMTEKIGETWYASDQEPEEKDFGNLLYLS